MNANETFVFEGQPQLQAEVILASRVTNTRLNPIFTLRLRYPRPIHGEIMTHRDFGRNARSSRAVPVKTMLNEVRNTPYVPWHWGKNQKGMQASEECNEPIKAVEPFHSGKISREDAWLEAANFAADTAEAFMEAGYHKQNPNRLLEPFAWIDTLITSTKWSNFLWLRLHEAAEPHLQDLAGLVEKALRTANIQELSSDEWHTPYITEDDRIWAVQFGEDAQTMLNKISAARCARISYKPFDGDASYGKEIDRYNLLVTSDRVHASPLEHQACEDLRSHREQMENPLGGNLGYGFVQARKLVPNEVYTG